MAYNEFAYFYDEFNGEADYDALYSQIHAKLEAHGIHDGIVADLGCGTGELTLMLTQAGYDMIGVDNSEEMLAEAMHCKGYRVEKAADLIPTLEEAFRQTVPSVIVVPVDYSENMKLSAHLKEVYRQSET